MKKILGVISIIVGIFAGLVVGIWWAFIGGIIQVVNALQASPIVGSDVAVGAAKILLATPIGEVVAGLFILAGITLIGIDFSLGKKKRK